MLMTLTERVRRYVTIYLRLALAAGFLTSVSDRFGLWGPSGTANVAWGSFQQFIAYTGQLNPWAPSVLISPLAWFVTVAEIVFGTALLLGLRTRDVALASGVLLGLFALGLTVGTGLKSALNYSVFAASAGAFALATERAYRWSLDALLTSRAKGQAAPLGEHAGRTEGVLPHLRQPFEPQRHIATSRQQPICPTNQGDST
jgi:thiosulfate dehydrogenase (quinone) large subunit